MAALYAPGIAAIASAVKGGAMGQFLRDQRLQHLNIDEAALDAINAVVIARTAAWNQQMAAAVQAQAAQPAAPQGQHVQAPHPGQVMLFKMAMPHYIIRFDGKGYRFTNFADLRQHYIDAGRVERVLLIVDSSENRQTGGLAGTQVELRLDAADAEKVYLTVTADDRLWVDDTFTTLMDVVDRRHNASGWFRTQWTGAVIQLLGVSVGFLLSVWAAGLVAPKLAIENPFAVSLIFVLLIFSNVWGYLNTQILRLVDIGFPNLRFRRKDKEGYRWLIRGVFIGLTVALTVWLLSQLILVAGSVLKSFLK